MFLLYYSDCRSRNCLKKILLMSGLVFLGLFLSSFGFFADVVAFLFLFSFSFSFFQRDRSGSHRAHPHTHLVFFCPFSFCVPAATGFISRFGRASFLSGVLSGCHSGPRAFFGFCFSDARRQGCFSASCALFCFSPFRSVLRQHTLLEGRAGAYTEPCPGRSEPAPRESDPQGSASCAEGWSPPFPGF